jgi:hypothetical protein
LRVRVSLLKSLWRRTGGSVCNIAGTRRTKPRRRGRLFIRRIRGVAARHGGINSTRRHVTLLRLLRICAHAAAWRALLSHHSLRCSRHLARTAQQRCWRAHSLLAASPPRRRDGSHVKHAARKHLSISMTYSDSANVKQCFGVGSGMKKAGRRPE